jgi:hypothetical protein
MAVDNPARGGNQFGGHPDAASRLQILSTEHWSLLATRSLAYQESFSRVGMFFSVLTGAVIALALVAQAGRFGEMFFVAASLALSVVFFVGVATIARLARVNQDDLRCVIGMNRLRHAYVELHPELERYFITDWHDDPRGVSLTMGLRGLPEASRISSAAHGFQTLPGMLSVIVAAVGGALCALIALAAGASQTVSFAVGGSAFLLITAAFVLGGRRSIGRYAEGISPRFPSPD